MEVYQTLTLMISFATLVVLILSFHKQNRLSTYIHRRQTAFRGRFSCDYRMSSASLKTYKFYNLKKK